jgi:hypothetical protein
VSGPESPGTAWPIAPQRPAPPDARPSRRARTLAIIGTVAALLASLVLGFYALLFDAFACFESCVEGSGDWRDDVDAWQYDVELGLAGAGVVLAVVSVILASTGRLRPAGYAVAAAAVTFAGWWTFVTS